MDWGKDVSGERCLENRVKLNVNRRHVQISPTYFKRTLCRYTQEDGTMDSRGGEEV